MSSPPASALSTHICSTDALYILYAQVRVCDSVYEPLEECCAAILTALSPLLSYASEDALSPVPPLSHSESSKLSGPSPLQIRCSWIVGKRAIGVLSELAISAGFLGQSKACSSALSILSRNTVHRLDTLPLQQHQQKYLRQYSADELNRSVSPMHLVTARSHLTDLGSSFCDLSVRGHRRLGRGTIGAHRCSCCSWCTSWPTSYLTGT